MKFYHMTLIFCKVPCLRRSSKTSLIIFMVFCSLPISKPQTYFHLQLCSLLQSNKKRHQLCLFYCAACWGTDLVLPKHLGSVPWISSRSTSVDSVTTYFKLWYRSYFHITLMSSRAKIIFIFGQSSEHSYNLDLGQTKLKTTMPIIQ